MPTFTYTARDRDGNPIEGSVIGADVSAVREQLRERELFLTSATVQNADEIQTQMRRSRRRVKLNDLVVMSRQLATLVRAGLPINECLHTVAIQSENLFLREVIQQVRRDILSGSSLTEAFTKQSHVFPELYIALVRAGEAGGVLEETLETAATQFDKEAELREQIKSAATYPLLVVFATFAVVAFLVVFIVPQFDRAYKSFGPNINLPPVTLSLITISSWVVTPWVDAILLVGGIFGTIATRRYISTHSGRRRWDRMKLRLWLVGGLNRKIAIARLTRTLSSMVRAGVPILQALTISARVSNNTIIQDAMSRVAEYVQQGARLWMPMEQTGEFPPLVTRMIAAGEESGNLDEMLIELTRFYERDVTYTVQKLTRVMEPIMTVFVGGIVLFVLIALYMPIFNLVNVIKQH